MTWETTPFRVDREKAMDYAISLMQSGIGDNVKDIISNAKEIEAYLQGEAAPARQSLGGMITAQPGIIAAADDKLKVYVEPEERPLTGPGSQEWSDRVTAEKAKLRAEGKLESWPDTEFQTRDEDDIR